MNLHKAIDDLCSSCEEVGRLSQRIDRMYSENKFEEVHSREEILKKEMELHIKIHRCNNLRVEIEEVCPHDAELKRDQ